MKGKVFIIGLILIFLFSFNTVCAGNFTDLKQEIDDGDSVSLYDDIILNYNTSNEENVYMEGISIADKEINIEGNNHMICGKDSNQNQVRIFNIINSNVTLSNLILTSAAFEGSGGAVTLDSNSTLILKNVTFKDNSVLGIYGEGGAVYSTGKIFAYGCLFENNYASGAGGAVQSQYSDCYIYSSEFINNTAKYYGGALYSGCFIEINSSYFENNHAYSGAAFHYALDGRSYEEAYAVLISSNFTANVANDGGSISTSSLRPVYVYNCNFRLNHASRGGVLYQNSADRSYFYDSSFDNNSADAGALFYEETIESSSVGSYAFTRLDSCILTNNQVSDKGSIFYGKSGNIWINDSLIYNNTNNPIYIGKGNITVLNSNISNSASDFIIMFIGGNIFVVNNTWGVSNADYEKISNQKKNSNIHAEEDELNLNINNQNIINENLNECCSVIVRINQTDYVISQRRDGGVSNYTVHIVNNENYIKQFKPCSEYYLLSKVYTNGWCYSNGGWDDSAQNEKIEAIADYMASNQVISMDALELILDTKMINEVGHFLIMAPDGTWGNLITYKGRTYIDMGVLEDGGYIVSPNDPDYRVQGVLSNITNGVDENINLSSRDTYGFQRHSIVAHHITLNDNDFSDSLYVSNEDGKFIGQENGIYCDNYWFKEDFIPESEIPLSLDKLYLGSFNITNSTGKGINLTAHDVVKFYGGSEKLYVYLSDKAGNPISNESVHILINGVVYTKITDENGTASLDLNLAIGEYDVLVYYNGTEVISINTSVTIKTTVNGADIIKVFRNGTQYYVALKDSQGNCLAQGSAVEFNINGVLYTRYVEDNEGRAKLNINLNPDNYIITVKNLKNGELSSNNITVISRIIENRDIVKYYRNDTQYAVRIIGDDGNPVGAGEAVTFNINGVLYNRTTNESGHVKLNINLAPGTYIITAEHKECRVSNNITVESVLYAEDLVKKYATSDQFKALLLDAQGSPYPGQEITFNINGVLYTRTTDNDGFASLNINLMAGEYIITTMHNGASISNTVKITT